jgi:hypothetical protein
MARDPRTPDCGVKGCTRAASSLGLCRAHRTLVPMTYGLQLSQEAMQSSHDIRLKWERRAIREANRVLKERGA